MWTSALKEIARNELILDAFNFIRSMKLENNLAVSVSMYTFTIIHFR